MTFDKRDRMFIYSQMHHVGFYVFGSFGLVFIFMRQYGYALAWIGMAFLSMLASTHYEGKLKKEGYYGDRRPVQTMQDSKRIAKLKKECGVS